MRKSRKWNGALWQGDDLAGDDAGHSLVERFITEHPHDGWTLSVYDTLSKENAEIACATDKIPDIASYIYNLEHAFPMTFIGENPLSESYVIGMRCTRGRIDLPGTYRDAGGKLVPTNAAPSLEL